MRLLYLIHRVGPWLNDKTKETLQCENYLVTSLVLLAQIIERKHKSFITVSAVLVNIQQLAFSDTQFFSDTQKKNLLYNVCLFDLQCNFGN